MISRLTAGPIKVSGFASNKRSQKIVCTLAKNSPSVVEGLFFFAQKSLDSGQGQRATRPLDAATRQKEGAALPTPSTDALLSLEQLATLGRAAETPKDAAPP